MSKHGGGFVKLIIFPWRTLFFFLTNISTVKGSRFISCRSVCKCQQLNRKKLGPCLVPIKLDPSCFLATQLQWNSLLYPFIRPQPASSEMKHTKSKYAFRLTGSKVLCKFKTPCSQNKCSSNSLCKDLLTHSPEWRSLTFRDSKFINRQQNNTCAILRFQCQWRHADQDICY